MYTHTYANFCALRTHALDSPCSPHRLCEYEDVRDPWDIYSLVALCAYHNEFYGICSKAFVKVGAAVYTCTHTIRGGVYVCVYGCMCVYEYERSPTSVM